MSRVPSFPAGRLEPLAKLLGDCGSGSEITHLLKGYGIKDHSGESTKWRRLRWVFTDVQCRDGCADRVLGFIQAFLDPARFVGRNEEFEAYR